MAVHSGDYNKRTIKWLQDYAHISPSHVWFSFSCVCFNHAIECFHNSSILNQLDYSHRNMYGFKSLHSSTPPKKKGKRLLLVCCPVLSLPVTGEWEDENPRISKPRTGTHHPILLNQPKFWITLVFLMPSYYFFLPCSLCYTSYRRFNFFIKFFSLCYASYRRFNFFIRFLNCCVVASTLYSLT